MVKVVEGVEGAVEEAVEDLVVLVVEVVVVVEAVSTDTVAQAKCKAYLS